MHNLAVDSINGLDVSLIHGTSAQMSELQEQSVDLIVTSPPYYSQPTEQMLDQGVSEKADLDALNQDIQAFAWTLRGTFEESQRVLRAGGCMVVQTRDVRIRQILSPVESIHRQLIEATGLRLYTKHFWLPLHQTLTRRRLSTALSKRFGPLNQDPEVFLVFIKPGPIRECMLTEADIALLNKALEPSTGGRTTTHHRYQAPAAVVKALIHCYSQPNDLVLDPFVGGATTLVAALAAGRRAVGYEIDPAALAIARSKLAEASKTTTEQ